MRRVKKVLTITILILIAISLWYNKTYATFTQKFEIPIESASSLDAIRKNIVNEISKDGYTGDSNFVVGETGNNRTWTGSNGTQYSAVIVITRSKEQNEYIYNATVSVTAEVLTADEASNYNSSNSSDSGDSSSVGGSGGHWVSSGSSSSDGSGIVSPIENPSYYEPSANTEEDNSLFSTMGGKIIGTIRAIGTVISVITLMTLGIRYMMASTQDKALYKETMIPYLIGAIMLFTIPNLIGILYDLVKNITF
jgi:hypothetical protein